MCEKPDLNFAHVLLTPQQKYRENFFLNLTSIGSTIHLYIFYVDDCSRIEHEEVIWYAANSTDIIICKHDTLKKKHTNRQPMKTQ